MTSCFTASVCYCASQLMDRSSPAYAPPSPGLAQKPSQCQVQGGLIKTQQWRKDGQTREERMCNEKSRGAEACTGLRNRDMFIGEHWRAAGTSSTPLHTTYAGTHSFCSPRIGAWLFLPKLWQILLQ